MSQSVAAPASLSRPKIHRLPAATPVFTRSPRFDLMLIKGCLMLTLLVAVAAMLDRVVTLSSDGDGTVARLMAGRPFDAPPASRISPVSDAVAAPAAAGTIIISDESGTIVGRMAKIPAQNEQITEIKPVSEVDNQVGRELLSIISKY